MNIENCLIKLQASSPTERGVSARAYGAFEAFCFVLKQSMCNCLGDLLHDARILYADQRISRLCEMLKTSSAPISQTPSLLLRLFDIPADSTMSEHEIDQVAFDLITLRHDKFKKALYYLIWRSEGSSPDVDPYQYGADVIKTHPRSNVVFAALRKLQTLAEIHREYIPHYIVIYSSHPDAETDRICLEGIYNVTLQSVDE